MRDRIFGYLEGEQVNGSLKVRRDTGRHEAWTETILPADAETEKPEVGTNKRPLFLVGAFMLLMLALLAGRLFYLQIVSGGRNLQAANGNRTREQVVRAPRGMIYDRNNQVLATNQANYDVVVVPQLLPADKAARRKEYQQVATLTGASAGAIESKIEKCATETDQSLCLEEPNSKLAVGNVKREQALLVDQFSDTLSGFSLDVNPIRKYNDNGLLAVFLGYTGRVNADEVAADATYGSTDLIGKLGLEKEYESELRGTNGAIQTEVDATGKPLRVLNNIDPQAGNSIVLSIDMGLQTKMAEVIQKQMGISGAHRAAGVALNPQTGEILAAVSLPSYDNNLFSGGISSADYAKLNNDSAGQPLFNKVISGAFPTGSIIKPFGASAALQEKIINTTTTVVDAGQLVVTNQYDSSIKYVYKGWEHSGLGVMNVYTAIAQSSDIFFYVIAGGFTNFTHYLGVDKLTRYYSLFGLGQKTGVDLPSETAGRVPTPAWKQKTYGQPWTTGDTYNIAVGQGDILASPLQMAAAISAVANGGKVYVPHFLLKVLDANGKTVSTVQPKVAREGFVSPENLAIVREGMREAVASSYGTACCKIQRDIPVQVAAKTGSAETDPEHGVAANSWFESFSPYNNPQIVTVILLEKVGEGAEFAAPATRELLNWYYNEGAGKNIQ